MNDLYLLMTEWAELEPDVCQLVSEGFTVKPVDAVGVYYILSPVTEINAANAALLISVIKNGCIKRDWTFKIVWHSCKGFMAAIFANDVFYKCEFQEEHELVVLLKVYLEALKGGEGDG